MENNERRSGIDRRRGERRKKIDEDNRYSELCHEIDCANIKIKRLSDEIREINKSHHD